MDYLQFAGNIILHKMDPETYDNAYGTNYKELFGDKLLAIYTATMWDKETGEVLAVTADNMLEFADNKFAYTFMGSIVETSLAQAIGIMLNSMEDL